MTDGCFTLLSHEIRIQFSEHAPLLVQDCVLDVCLIQFQTELKFSTSDALLDILSVYNKEIFLHTNTIRLNIFFHF